MHFSLHYIVRLTTMIYEFFVQSRCEFLHPFERPLNAKDCMRECSKSKVIDAALDNQMKSDINIKFRIGMRNIVYLPHFLSALY